MMARKNKRGTLDIRQNRPGWRKVKGKWEKVRKNETN